MGIHNSLERNKWGCATILHNCVDCGKERRVRLIGGKPERIRCAVCVRKGTQNIRWKGGRINLSGYVLVYIPDDSPFCSMRQKNRYVLEHRLVMAKHLGRCLQTGEIVHHKNGIRSDNRQENLELMGSQSEHFPSIKVKQELRKQALQIKDLQARVTTLEYENVLLKTQLELGEVYEYTR